MSTHAKDPLGDIPDSRAMRLTECVDALEGTAMDGDATRLNRYTAEEIAEATAMRDRMYPRRATKKLKGGTD